MEEKNEKKSVWGIILKVIIVVATAIGNYLSSIPSQLWDKIPLVYNWAILIGLCLISAIVMFALLKKLKAMTA